MPPNPGEEPAGMVWRRSSPPYPGPKSPSLNNCNTRAYENETVLFPHSRFQPGSVKNALSCPSQTLTEPPSIA